MTYTLYIGDRAYSSWSLRGWLLFAKFGIPVKTEMVPFDDPRPVSEQLAKVAPAKTVPTMITPEGIAVSESLAIAEELASRHPSVGLWPQDPADRANARTLAAEMASGFGPLRTACPMNLRLSYSAFHPDEDVLADLKRIETIWDHAQSRKSTPGPWLLGAYSAADAFFAPVAARIAGYGLPVGKNAAAYVEQVLCDHEFRQWRAMGLARGAVLEWYKRDFGAMDWPGPEPLKAVATTSGPSENQTCPYSGKPVTDFLEIDGRVFGFCNPFCRDKTLCDPLAWPAFQAIYQT